MYSPTLLSNSLTLISSSGSWTGLLSASLLLLLAVYILRLSGILQTFGLPKRQRQALFPWLKQFNLSAIRKYWTEQSAYERNSKAATGLHAVARTYQERTEQARIKLVMMLVIFAGGFVTGGFAVFGWMQAREHSEQRAFERGKEARDLEAYTNLHSLHEMTVVTQYSETMFDVQPKRGGSVTPMTFCEPPGLIVGMTISGAFYHHGKCASLNGPKAWIEPSEGPNGEPLKQISMKEKGPAQ